MKLTLLAIIAVTLMNSTQAKAKHPITFEDLMKIQRISDPQVSPDGRWIVYGQRTVDLAANSMSSHLWLIPASGGEPRQLTFEGSNRRARWSPDSKSLAFISSRGGSSQIWVLPMEGGEPRKLTSISTEADGVSWAAKGDTLLFTSSVYPDCADDACNKQRLEADEKSKVKARLIHNLLFRHWDQWGNGRYTHLFVVSTKGGAPRDLTPGAYDAPAFSLEGPDGYAISPDGSEACYSSNRSTPPSAVAWTTNNHLYLVPTEGGEPRDITPGDHGSNASPQYSPDGRYIAFTSQARNGYESDLLRLFVYDRRSGQSKSLTEGFDQWVSQFIWAPDSNTLYFSAPQGVRQPIFKTSVSHPNVEKVLDGFNEDFVLTPEAQSLILTRSSLTQPTEVFRSALVGGALQPLTTANNTLLADLDVTAGETVHSDGALGAKIESLIVKPPAFDSSKKYPGLVLIHGGPQGAWTDAWGYRWNAQMFASHGYVVMMTNFHGSTGRGQKFTEEISGDWGGAPYEDIMKATDYLAALPYVDGSRLVAAGASYGGYMVNWIAGHTTRFKALVSHDGVYDLKSMYGETEELWFPEWELKGVPWEHPELYQKWSPSNFVQNIQTPMLVVEGGLDFRVPEGQAFQLFTALQRRSVPSQLLYFPNAGHWILKPQDSQLWYRTVLAWLDRYARP